MMMPTPTNTFVRLNSSPPLIATAMPATADNVPIAASTTCALLQIILRRAWRFGEFQGSIGIGLIVRDCEMIYDCVSPAWRNAVLQTRGYLIGVPMRVICTAVADT